MQKPKRINKSKEELVSKAKQEAKIARMVALVKTMWPLLQGQKSIYDTQTTLFAIAGYAELGVKLKEDELTINDLGIDISKEDEGPIKHAMNDILVLLGPENAKDIITVTRKLADTIGQFGASQFVKGPMKNIKVTDLVQ